VEGEIRAGRSPAAAFATRLCARDVIRRLCAQSDSKATRCSSPPPHSLQLLSNHIVELSANEAFESGKTYATKVGLSLGPLLLAAQVVPVPA